MSRPSRPQGRASPLASGGPALSDADLFAAEMADVAPLPKAPEPPPVGPRPVPRARQRELDEARVPLELMAVDPWASEIEFGESLSFRRDGLSLRDFRRLKRGDYAVQDEIDLHTMTVAQATLALAQFLADANERGYSCVRVIHGKGYRSGPQGPVLKKLVDQALRTRKQVLGFASAPLNQGGQGAALVLLRRRTAVPQ